MATVFFFGKHWAYAWIDISFSPNWLWILTFFSIFILEWDLDTRAILNYVSGYMDHSISENWLQVEFFFPNFSQIQLNKIRHWKALLLTSKNWQKSKISMFSQTKFQNITKVKEQSLFNTNVTTFKIQLIISLSSINLPQKKTLRVKISVKDIKQFQICDNELNPLKVGVNENRIVSKNCNKKTKKNAGVSGWSRKELD